jgi:hypothetical protein
MAFYGPMGPDGFRRRGRRRGDTGELAGASIASRRQRRAIQAVRWDWRPMQENTELYPREEP